MQIILSNKKEIITQEEVIVEAKEVTVISYTDNFESVEATIVINNGRPQIIKVWDGEDYRNLKQVTHSDIKNRIVEILGL